MNKEKDFYISVTITLNRVVKTKAISLKEAKTKVEEAFQIGKFVIDQDDWCNTEYEAEDQAAWEETDGVIEV